MKLYADLLRGARPALFLKAETGATVDQAASVILATAKHDMGPWPKQEVVFCIDVCNK